MVFFKTFVYFIAYKFLNYINSLFLLQLYCWTFIVSNKKGHAKNINYYKNYEKKVDSGMLYSMAFSVTNEKHSKIDFIIPEFTILFR